jgi:hypothetical protein
LPHGGARTLPHLARACSPAPLPPRCAAAAQRCKNSESIAKTNFKFSADSKPATAGKLCFKLSAARKCDSAATTCCFDSASFIKGLYITNMKAECLVRAETKSMVVSVNGSPNRKKPRRLGYNLNLALATSVAADTTICVDVSGARARGGGGPRARVGGKV